MSTSSRTRAELKGPVGGDSAGGERGEPGGRAARAAGAARAPQLAVAELAPEVRERLSDELFDELLAGARTEEEIVGPGGLLADLTRRLVERALSAELTDHLGYEPHPNRLAGRQHAQRHDAEDAGDRAWAGQGQGPSGS
jgi:hypothetical protein